MMDNHLFIDSDLDRDNCIHLQFFVSFSRFFYNFLFLLSTSGGSWYWYNQNHPVVKEENNEKAVESEFISLFL